MDTARKRDVFPVGDEREVTPELADIADDGVRFERAFAAAPWTLPSHASLLTGTYPSKHGAHGGHKRLDDRVRSLPTTFREAGYETVGVSNNTWISDEFGFDRGFETFRKTWQYVQSTADLERVARTNEGVAKFREFARELLRGNPLVNAANAVYGHVNRKRTDEGAERTNEWIREWLGNRDDDRPFFLFANYLEPHLEYRPPREHARRFLPAGVSYEEAMAIPQKPWKYLAGEVDIGDREFDALRALYRGEVAYLDDRIGEFRNLLRSHGAWEDTVFVVVGDHGENVGDHGMMDHQYCVYDTLLHVPLVVRGGAFAGGRVDDSLVQLTDLAPTLLDAAEVEDPVVREQAQGTSFHPNATGDSRDFAYAEYVSPQPSIETLEERVGPLPDDVYAYDRSLRAVREDGWKLIRGSDGSRELYRVCDDPEETENLVDDRPERAARLSDVLDDWLASFEHADVSGAVSMSNDAQRRLEDLGYLQ